MIWGQDFGFTEADLEIEADENEERSQAGGSERVEGLEENNELAIFGDLLEFETNGGN
jgi:hypothetical protein